MLWCDVRTKHDPRNMLEPETNRLITTFEAPRQVWPVGFLVSCNGAACHSKDGNWSESIVVSLHLLHPRYSLDIRGPLTPHHLYYHDVGWSVFLFLDLSCPSWRWLRLLPRASRTTFGTWFSRSFNRSSSISWLLVESGQSLRVRYSSEFGRRCFGMHMDDSLPPEGTCLGSNQMSLKWSRASFGVIRWIEVRVPCLRKEYHRLSRPSKWCGSNSLHALFLLC